MNYKEYQQIVIKSEKGSLETYPKILHAVMGMNGEAGECIDLIKKTIFQGHPLEENHILSELGDVCWYTMLFITELDIDPKYIFEYTNTLREKDTNMSPQIEAIQHYLELNYYCGKCGDMYRLYSECTPKMSILSTIREVIYCIERIADTFNKTIEDIFQINYDKIKKRYPEGFSCEQSINRDGEIK